MAVRIWTRRGSSSIARGWCGVVTAGRGSSGALRERAGSPEIVLRATPTEREHEVVAEYTAFAFSLAHGISWPGSTRDDVRQEALLGVLYAVRTWRPDGGLSLKGLIALAVRRQLWTAIKAAHREKHEALNSSLRFAFDDADELVSIAETIPDLNADVHRALMADWILDEIKQRVARMSDLEQRSLLGVALGVPYSQIDQDEKRVDNALQRARKKLADLQEAA
jgi:RNA polymerase sporulation-specific sigma factor